jgi:predicted GIY-YIG superfamily endonuclease
MPRPAPSSRKTSPKHHHSVYVIELSRGVLYERKFQRANPDYDPQKPCLYIGMTGLDPDVRFDKHKAGVQSNRFVQKYGERLRPDLYASYNPMPYEGAREMEVELAVSLREKGYGVWQG